MLRDVDDALATLGAPPEHAVWGLLRRLRTTPGDAVAFFADLTSDGLRVAASLLGDEATEYAKVRIPGALPWDGSVADFYAVSAAALETHLSAQDAPSMLGSLRATASYVDAVAGWCQFSRDDLARILARALMSSQAVAVRSFPSLGRDLGETMRVADRGALALAVTAAADIGAAVLGVAEDAVVAAQALHREAATSLAELPYRAPTYVDPLRHDATIRLHH
jgi:hypothetical protein